MRTIHKTAQEPECLRQQPAGRDWGDFMRTDCHGIVAEALLCEQFHLCCYCESEIKERRGHIEHLIPRSNSPSHAYDYSNLSASCPGGNGRNRHCGIFRKNMYDAMKFSSPHNPATASLFHYMQDGMIKPADGLNDVDKEKAEYFINLLNLNCPRLAEMRHSHAKKLISWLGPNPSEEQKNLILDYFLKPDPIGKLRSFASLSQTLLARA